MVAALFHHPFGIRAVFPTFPALKKLISSPNPGKEDAFQLEQGWPSPGTDEYPPHMGVQGLH